MKVYVVYTEYNRNAAPEIAGVYATREGAAEAAATAEAEHIEDGEIVEGRNDDGDDDWTVTVHTSEQEVVLA